MEQNKRIHLTAICGTGMGSLAGLLKQAGHTVMGSDQNVYPPMSDQLAAQNIPVYSGFNADNFDQSQPDLVIIGNAVSQTNVEVQSCQERKLPILSMPEAVEKLFLKNRFPIVIAGTHGKTTTCALTAWLLEKTGQSPSFLIGGILKNFGKSFQLGSGNYFVIEGDEYDSAFFDKKAKFLHYHPKLLILNPVEFDHADIYKNLEHVMQAFSELIEKMSPDALIVACGDSEHVRTLIKKAPCRVITFGSGSHCQMQLKNLTLAGETRFDMYEGEKKIGTMVSPLMGEHNAKNLLGVVSALLDLGINFADLCEAVSLFEGVKRRQEIFGEIKKTVKKEVQKIILIDDFAHHPTAVVETLKAIRGRYPQSRLWAIFEPRSNTTRRKVFQKEFAMAFDVADQIIFAAPYQPEKIPEEERLSPEEVIADLKERGKSARYIPDVDQIVQSLAAEVRPQDVIVFMSNGGFGGIYQKVKGALG